MTQINFYQITFTCPRNTADPLSRFLEASNALSVSLMDAGDEPIFEPGLDETPLWPEVKVVALFQTEEQLQETVFTLEQLLENIPNYEIEILEQRDWVAETQAQFPPQCFGHKLWIYPEWETIPAEHTLTLKLAPGLAFGTGTHPTTQMCLEALSQMVEPGMQIVDFGCGSGILGLAAAALGAKKVYCVDIDPQALAATQSNAELNQFSNEQIIIGHAEILTHQPVDILVANILAKPLIELQNIFQKLLKSNGNIILAGILETQADLIIAAYAPWKTLHRFKQTDEWVCLVG